MPAPGNVWAPGTWDPNAWASGTWAGAAAATIGADGQVSPLQAIDILDQPTCAGGRILVRLIDCISRTAEFTVSGEDRFDVVVPASSAAAQYLTSRYVVRAQFADNPDNYHEWRFLDDDALVKQQGGTITATAYDLVNDLAAAGPIRAIDATTGLPAYAFSVEATATELIDTYILPRLAMKGYTWIARGEIEPTAKRRWEWDRLNPFELVRLIASVEQCEYRLRRNGTTDYRIALMGAINSSLAAIDLRTGVNLTQLRRTRKGANHYTVLEGFGATQGDGQRATVARAAWKVTAIDPGTNRLTLGDPSGAGPGPIVEDDQFLYTSEYPGYLFRYHQGGLHRVVDSFAATQEVQVDPGLVATYAVGDLVEIRGGAGASGVANEITDGWTAGLWAARRVTNVDAGNQRLTIDDPWADTDMVPLDDRYRGWTVRPYFRAASSSMSANVAAANPEHRQCTVASTTGMQAGDLVYISSSNPSGAPNWSLVATAAFEVVTVDSATLVTIQHRRKAGAVGSLTNGVLSAWRARTDRVCTACVASADTLDVDDVTSIVVGDVIEVVRQYDGPIRTELASPAGIAVYGTRVGTFEREEHGERTLLLNGLFDDFTGGAHALPDHWHGVSRTFGLQNTDGQFLKYGTSSVRLTSESVLAISGAIGAGATSAVVIGSAGHRLEVGESVRLSAGTGSEETVVITNIVESPPVSATITFAPTTNAHANGAAVRSVLTPTVPTIVGSTLTGHARLVAAPIDCPTVGGLNTFGLIVWYYARNFVAGDQVILRLTIGSSIGSLAHTELGGTQAQETITFTVGTDIDADTINGAFILATQPIAGGRITVEIAANLAGGDAYPHDKELFVCSAGLAQVNYDYRDHIPAVSNATALHQAANTKLGLVSLGAPASYELGLVDLYGADPRTWPHLQLIPGVLARTTQAVAGVAGEPLRILKLRVDYDQPADVQAEVGTRHQRLTEILASATVPVPRVLVTVNADGSTTTTVLTDTSRQPLVFPRSSGVTPINTSGLFTE